MRRFYASKEENGLVKKRLMFITAIMVGLLVVITFSKATMWYDDLPPKKQELNEKVEQEQEYVKQHKAPKDPKAGYLPEAPANKDPNRPIGNLDET
jgi:hypothetical protein